MCHGESFCRLYGPNVFVFSACGGNQCCGQTLFCVEIVKLKPHHYYNYEIFFQLHAYALLVMLGKPKFKTKTYTEGINMKTSY